MLSPWHHLPSSLVTLRPENIVLGVGNATFWFHHYMNASSTPTPIGGIRIRNHGTSKGRTLNYFYVTTLSEPKYVA